MTDSNARQAAKVAQIGGNSGQEETSFRYTLVRPGEPEWVVVLNGLDQEEADRRFAEMMRLLNQRPWHWYVTDTLRGAVGFGLGIVIALMLLSWVVDLVGLVSVE